MGEFPSGQRGQTVNLLRFASMVRIRPPPPQKIQHLPVLDFLSCWRQIRKSKSQHASGMLLPPVQKLVATLRCTHRVQRQSNPSSPVPFKEKSKTKPDVLLSSATRPVLMLQFISSYQYHPAAAGSSQSPGGPKRLLSHNLPTKPP